MEYYWEILTFEGDKIEIPPAGIDVIKRRWDNGQPIHTRTRGSIPANQIKSFTPTAKPYGQQPLLEAAAQAFNEPVLREDGGIASRWVKKEVTPREFEKHYAAIPAYKRLGDSGGMVTVAFILPVHQIDATRVDYCNDDEVQQLARH